MCMWDLLKGEQVGQMQLETQYTGVWSISISLEHDLMVTSTFGMVFTSFQNSSAGVVVVIITIVIVCRSVFS